MRYWRVVLAVSDKVAHDLELVYHTRGLAGTRSRAEAGSRSRTAYRTSSQYIQAAAEAKFEQTKLKICLVRDREDDSVAGRLVELNGPQAVLAVVSDNQHGSEGAVCIAFSKLPSSTRGPRSTRCGFMVRDVAGSGHAFSHCCSPPGVSLRRKWSNLHCDGKRANKCIMPTVRS